LPFEATITLSPSNTWFYKLGDDGAKSIATLEPMWDQCTAQSNRLVLNAPPDRNGVLLPSNSNALVRLAHQLGLVPGRPFPVNLAEGCRATASSVWENDSTDYGAALAVDANPNSRWASGPVGITNGWLAIDFDKPTTFNQVIIREYAKRVQRFQLQVWERRAWKTILTDKTIGAYLRVDFPAVTTSRLRLNILSSREAPSIYMFKVHYIEAKDSPAML
jgi:alpha-L-fucosidase